MQANKWRDITRFILIVLGLSGAFARPADASGYTFNVLYDFCVIQQPFCADGWAPDGGVVMDAAGNLYGTTTDGGIHNTGNVFELSQGADGKWTETTLFSFNGTGTYPYAGVTLAGGNIYGTTQSGGVGGVGTVFELSPKKKGGWMHSAIFGFPVSDGVAPDGATPLNSLLADAAGNLYGNATGGGGSGYGTEFEISPGARGYSFKLLVDFDLVNGCCPGGPPIFDGAGNLFGTTNGGADSDGSVIELSPRRNGTWAEKTLFTFAGRDGRGPSGVVMDSTGNLYGTTFSGDFRAGTGYGTVFKLAEGSDGKWALATLYAFHGGDGEFPEAGLVVDAAGNLFGTTSGSVNGGGNEDYGSAFELSPGADGTWTLTTLVNFDGTNGGYPVAGLILDAAGNLYGTTTAGGAHGEGVVFELSARK